MSSAETTSKYGRTDARKAEPPAKPAATINGTSGTQQLDAATTLASAPALANRVLRLSIASFTANLLRIAERLPYRFKRRNPLGEARFSVCRVIHACSSTCARLDIVAVNAD